MRGRWSAGALRFVREPLVHFVLLGAAVFGLYEGMAPAEDTRRVILVDSSLRARLHTELARRLGRPPGPEQLESEIERWVDEEVLYREGLALGLDREDPLVRDRVVRNMTFLHEQSASVAEPTRAELEAWFEQRRDQYTMPDRVDFVQVFAGDAQAHADELRDALRGGATPSGEPFRLGSEFRRRSRGNIETLFGRAFADALVALEPGTWEILPSTHGLHVVRLDARHGGTPRFDDLEKRVAGDFQREQQRIHAREAAERLRESYRVQREEP